MSMCGGCDSTWTGSNVCHCARCCQSFKDVQLFDRHLAGANCRNPARMMPRMFLHGEGCSAVWHDTPESEAVGVAVSH